MWANVTYYLIFRKAYIFVCVRPNRHQDASLLGSINSLTDLFREKFIQLHLTALKCTFIYTEQSIEQQQQQLRLVHINVEITGVGTVRGKRPYGDKKPSAAHPTKMMPAQFLMILLVCITRPPKLQPGL